MARRLYDIGTYNSCVGILYINQTLIDICAINATWQSFNVFAFLRVSENNYNRSAFFT